MFYKILAFLKDFGKIEIKEENIFVFVLKKRFVKA